MNTTQTFSTNSKQVRATIKQHIIDCVYDYEENAFLNFDSAAKHLKSEFQRVANYPNNVRNFPNEADRFSDYLQGLPFHFHFANWDISEYLQSLNLNGKQGEYDSDKQMKLYHYLIYKEVFR